jgi:hypothetical protein
VPNLGAIESAIRDLPEPEFWELAEWFDALKADAWDARLEADAKAGRLEGAAQQALADLEKVRKGA